MSKTISRDFLLAHLADVFEIHRFKDYCPKGLVVQGQSEINHCVTGVSLSLELIEQAIQNQAELIIVHHPHGFWDNQSKLAIGVHRRKLQLLIQHDINVFAYHLPMDAHLILGNNAQLGAALGLKHSGSFAPHGGVDLGWIGDFNNPLKIEDFITLTTNQCGSIIHHFSGGAKQIKRVAICTGAAPNELESLIALGNVDLYLTGEARENTQSLALENKIHFVAAGHHQTEVFGPRALCNYLQSQLDLSAQFINISNPV